MSRVRQSENGCLIWTGAAKPSGYGNINIEGRTESTHRASWMAFKGSIPPGMIVCHHCDTPACVNPDHLFLGSHKDNAADMDAKGRRVVTHRHGAENPMYGRNHTVDSKRKQSDAKKEKYIGGNHPRATISEQTARKIKLCKGRITAKETSIYLNVSFHVVRNIWAGKSWGCVNG